MTRCHDQQPEGRRREDHDRSEPRRRVSGDRIWGRWCGSYMLQAISMYLRVRAWL